MDYPSFSMRLCELLYAFIAGVPGNVLLFALFWSAAALFLVATLTTIDRIWFSGSTLNANVFRYALILSLLLASLALMRTYGMTLLPCDPVSLDFVGHLRIVCKKLLGLP